MTVKELCSAIAFSEKKKTQTSIGNVREVIGILSDLIMENAEVMEVLIKNGKQRKKKVK